MRAVLTSVQPPNTNNIFDGFKGIEWRTRPMPLGKHYCYETKNGGGSGKVIGQFIITGIQRFSTVEAVPEILMALGCVSREELKQYQKGRMLYAHWIEEPLRYPAPIELYKFYRKCERMTCEGCEHLKYQRVNSAEYDYDCEFLGNKIPITRPPQSWCYVESGGVE